jgi:hypothetical protein
LDHYLHTVAKHGVLRSPENTVHGEWADQIHQTQPCLGLCEVGYGLQTVYRLQPAEKYQSEDTMEDIKKMMIQEEVIMPVFYCMVPYVQRY